MLPVSVLVVMLAVGGFIVAGKANLPGEGTWPATGSTPTRWDRFMVDEKARKEQGASHEPLQERGLQSAGSHASQRTSLRAKARAPHRFMAGEQVQEKQLGSNGPQPGRAGTPRPAALGSPGTARPSRVETGPPGWLAERERRFDEGVWKAEILAQACARTLEQFWDNLNAASNRLSAAGSLEFHRLTIPTWGPPDALAHGIQLSKPAGQSVSLSRADWLRLIRRRIAEGWALDQVEFRHVRFETNTAGRAANSVFSLSAHLRNQARGERLVLEGDLDLAWSEGPSARRGARIGHLDASRLRLKRRVGALPFREELNLAVEPFRPRFSVDPLILHDLDGDGLSEILLPSVNAFYRRERHGGYVAATLCRFPPGVVYTAVMGDFNGDGLSDLLCARAEGLVLYSRSKTDPSFAEPEQVVWRAPEPLLNPMVLTCGDLDQDGDLDLFLGQYRVPTMGQVLRPWYYDARDGFPAYLLRNDGDQFTDITENAGIGPKRGRRTYSASFVDLDADGWLDLVVVSDFAGIDLYRNEEGRGLHDMTDTWVPDAQGFGMAHAIADFDVDGRADVLMIGMNSPTVDRLEHLALRRPGSGEDFAMRPRMAYGNRLFISQPGGGFRQTALNHSLARTGWSWGCAAADFDNDSRPDVYVANGLQSQASVRDFEPEFWLHDIYVDESVRDEEATRYFMDKFAQTRGNGWSYGGYEKNRFLLRTGDSFEEIGYLLGVALEQDSRNVAADDLDGDGRLDLVVTTMEVWPEPRQTLRVFRNELADTGAWVGFRLSAIPGGPSPIGTSVAVTAGASRMVRPLVTGDSHRTQHAPVLHFGLGKAGSVDQVEIRDAQGRGLEVRNLVTNRYHEFVLTGSGPRMKSGNPEPAEPGR